MIRKTLVFLFLSIVTLAGSLTASAQMTDDAVVEYVKDGMANGKSQNDMIKELAAKGVTKAQAQRIKEAMEKEQGGQMEAVKMAGAQERKRRVKTGVLQSDDEMMGYLSGSLSE